MPGSTSRTNVPLFLLQRAFRHARLARSFALQPLSLAIGAALAVSANAALADDPNPYYIGLSEAVTHNTNIFNTTDGRGDTYSSTGLLGGVDQSIGRQHISASGNVTLNRYRSETELNNTSYALNAGLDWQTIGQISGTVYTRLSQNLANLNNNLLQTTDGRNVVRDQQIGARARWGGNSLVSVEGGYGHSKSSYSAPSLQASDSSGDSADIGLYFHPGATLTLGTALRYTRSRSNLAFLLSDGTYLDNETSGRNIDFSANWHPTVQSGINARVSWTNQSSSSPGSDGFSGLTGSIGFNYIPTGKLSFNGQLSRDASTNGSFYNTFTGTTSQPTVGLAANSTVSNSISLGAVYSVTAKVSATASVQYLRTTQAQNDNSNASLASYRDNLKSGSLSVTWAIRRYWSAGCSVSHVQRTLDGSFNNDYSGSTYGCSTQVTLR